MLLAPIELASLFKKQLASFEVSTDVLTQLFIINFSVSLLLSPIKYTPNFNSNIKNKNQRERKWISLHLTFTMHGFHDARKKISTFLRKFTFPSLINIWKRLSSSYYSSKTCAYLFFAFTTEYMLSRKIRVANLGKAWEYSTSNIVFFGWCVHFKSTS